MSNTFFNKVNVISLIVAGLSVELSIYFKKLLFPLIIMLIAMAIDYITGLIKAYMQKELSSKKGMIGIFKKFAYILVVVVGIIADYLCKLFIAEFDINFTFTIPIALLLAIWLTINELISILENLNAINVPMPKFLQTLISKLKNTVEENTNGN